MNHQLNRFYLPIFSVLLLLFLAACGQDNPAAATTPSAPGFSFSIDPAASSAELKALSPGLAVAAPAGCVDGTRILTPGAELKLTDYTATFLPGNMLEITASFTNTTANTYEQPFTFSADADMTSNIVSSVEPTVTDADLGGDGKLSPDETTTVLTFTVKHKGQAFNYSVLATAEVSCAGTDPVDPTDPTDPVDPEPVVCTDPVTIPDEGLERSIRFRGGRDQPTGDITCDDMESLTSLYASGENISDIEGLQYAVNLDVIFLQDNQVSDISVLKGLTKLDTLVLTDNQISDISVLSSLPILQNLSLENNRVSDIGPLEGLTDLLNLYLDDNQISDLSPLEDLALGVIYLRNNQVSDVSPLRDVTNLVALYLKDNQLGDISPLKSLTRLEFLDLSDNQISDISALSDLTEMWLLYLGNNQISDISPLEGLNGIQFLELYENQISDIRPIFYMDRMQDLSLYGNQISDIRTLSRFINLQNLSLAYNQITDIGPLVTNVGIGNGGRGDRKDFIELEYNCLDLSTGSKARADIALLENRNPDVVNIYVSPQDVSRCSNN